MKVIFSKIVMVDYIVNILIYYYWNKINFMIDFILVENRISLVIL